MKLNLLMRLILLLITLVFVIGVICEQGQQETGNVIKVGPQIYNVDISNYSFSSQTLNIKVGDTVIWTNKDSTRQDIKRIMATFIQFL